MGLQCQHLHLLAMGMVHHHLTTAAVEVVADHISDRTRPLLPLAATPHLTNSPGPHPMVAARHHRPGVHTVVVVVVAVVAMGVPAADMAVVIGGDVPFATG